MLQKKLIYPFIFILTVAAYCIFLAGNGYEEWDSGFVTGLAWRIINGEVMYRDFIYTKPPLTPYYASFLISVLPDEGQFYFIRCINYITFAAQVLLTVFAINNIYNLKQYGLNLWAVALAGFVISLLNFSMYPWYTQDGLLFAAIALYLKSINKNSLLILFIIAFAAMLSAFSKQSFYPVPLIFLVWVFIDYGFKKAIVFSIMLLLPAALLMAWVLNVTTMHNFLDCVTGQTQLYDLYYTCVYGYLHKNTKLYLIILAVTLLAGVNYKNIKATSFAVLFKWFIVLQFVAAIVLLFAGNAQLGSIIAFNSCGCAVVYNFFILKKTFQYLYPSAALLAISWCVSVSWGYPYPVLFATALICIFIVLTYNFFPIPHKVRTALAVITIIAAFAYNWYPYRNDGINELTYSMETISPKLKYIRTDKTTFDKFAELKSLVSQYGQPYIVTTNYSGSHYLFETRNPLIADWMINSEMSYKLNRMVTDAAKSNGHIFLEKKYNPSFDLKDISQKHFSYFSQYIYDNCTPIEKRTYFTVYDTKELREKLPETTTDRAVH